MEGMIAQARRCLVRRISDDVGRIRRTRVIISPIMTKVEQLEKQVQNLTPEELVSFRNWFTEYDWLAWDRQLEADAGAGKLDEFAAEALAEHERGETTDL
jgi:hypothetical protein